MNINIRVAHTACQIQVVYESRIAYESLAREKERDTPWELMQSARFDVTFYTMIPTTEKKLEGTGEIAFYHNVKCKELEVSYVNIIFFFFYQ